MKTILSCTFISLTLAFNFTFSQGFNSITTPDGVHIAAAGDNGLIYHSSNSGTNWFSMNEPSVNFKSIFSLNNNIWIAGDNSTVYKTDLNISLLSSYSISGNHTLNSIFFIDENTGFVCGNNGAIFKSINSGINWSISNSGIAIVNLKSISFKDSAAGVVTGENGAVYTTTNGGITWTNETVPSQNNFLKAKYFTDGIAIAGENGTLILKTGTGWESVDTKVTTSIRGITGSGINDVHVCGGGGFIRNNKNGSSGFMNFEPNPMMANLTDIFYYDNNLGFGVSSLNNAIIKTSNSGQGWSLQPGCEANYSWELKLDVPGGWGNTLCASPFGINTIFVGMMNKIYVSRDKGNNWSFLDSIPYTNFGIRSFYVSPLDSNIWVAAIASSIVKTTNYGQTWTVSIAMPFSTFGQPLEMDQNDPSVFYFAPDGGGFYKSTDNGSSFNSISSYPFQSPCDIIVQWDNSEVLLVGDGPTNGSGAKVYRSENGGVNWNLVLSSNFAEIPSMCNTVFDNEILYVMEYGSACYKSTDFGSTFFVTYTSSHSNWASAVCLEDPDLVIGGSFSFSGSAFITYNGGANWKSFPQAGYHIQSGLISPEKNYALYYGPEGVVKLKVDYSGTNSIHENIFNGSQPESFMLNQNYPNPFNPKTIISYQVYGFVLVNLSIYDVLGNKLITLVNKKQRQGSYEIEFNASSLSSGVYFYKIEAGDFIETKRMILLK